MTHQGSNSHFTAGLTAIRSACAVPPWLPEPKGVEPQNGVSPIRNMWLRLAPMLVTLHGCLAWRRMASRIRSCYLAHHDPSVTLTPRPCLPLDQFSTSTTHTQLPFLPHHYLLLRPAIIPARSLARSCGTSGVTLR